MKLRTFLAMGLCLILLTVALFSGSAAAESDENEFAGGLVEEFVNKVGPEEHFGPDNIQSGTRFTRSSTWTEPEFPQQFGDDFSQRAIFVDQNDFTFLDDMLYCAAVPAAVHWEGSTRYESLMISDDFTRENGNILGDYIKYLENVEAEPDIDYIGSIDQSRKTQLEGYFTDVDQVNTVTTADNVYEGSADIAKFYWQNQRQLGTDTAVLAYVPEANGGTEARADHTGQWSGQYQLQMQRDVRNLSWLRHAVEWDDPGADTDYRVAIQDPFVLHRSQYSNHGTPGHVNPTDNKLFDHYGYSEVSVAPFYSSMPYRIDTDPQPMQSQTNSGTLPPGDLSMYPVQGGSDFHSYTFGPVKKGEWIGILTNWTYYSFNETIYRDFNSYVYLPGDPVGLDYHLEVISNDPFDPMQTRGTPELGYCYAPVDGMYTVAVHPHVSSIGGNYNVTAYWGGAGDVGTYTLSQTMPGLDTLDYHIMEYEYLEDWTVESITNGASTASLKNVPMLYTAGGTPEQVIVDALNEIGINNLIIIDPGNNITTSGWTGLGFDVEDVKGDKEVFNYIYNITKEKKLHKGLILNGLGGPWFTGTALAAAYHGVPAPAMDGQEAIDIQSMATTLWWKNIQNTIDFDSFPLTIHATPSDREMEQVADMFYDWIEDYNADFNPDCGDSDGDGIPDNGKFWDYSEDVEILVISPMNAVKPTLDRALNGKASIGRIQIGEPEALWAVMARQMMYWKVGFSQADNPDNPNDSPPVKDHWNRVCWTLNTYAHDDGIMDNDSGDQDDDDFCWYDDGGIQHRSYRTREDEPGYTAADGRVNVFDTYYDNIRDTLEGGTSMWSEHGHGHSYWMMETGIGFTGTGVDPANPKWGGPVPDTGFVDPPLDTTTGMDWYLDMDNIHSTFATWQSCQVGGSAIGEYFLRLGGIGAIGGYVTRSLVEATIQDDRTVRGLYNFNMTFGEAHRWGADEIGAMYSLKDPGAPFFNFSDAGYADSCWKTNGATGHTIYWGDASNRMISRTLFLDVAWELPKSGDQMVIEINVFNQSGYRVNADELFVELDSETLTVQNDGAGAYSAIWNMDKKGTVLDLKVTAKKAMHESPQGTDEIIKDFEVVLPDINLVPGNVSYTGNMTQTIDVDGRAFLPDDGNAEIIDGAAACVDIFTVLDVDTGLSANLTFVYGAWRVEDLDVSELPEGEYKAYFFCQPEHWVSDTACIGNFTVVHELEISGIDVDYYENPKTLDIVSVKVKSSWSKDGFLDNSDVTSAEFEIFAQDSDEVLIDGTLGFNSGTSTFEEKNRDVATLGIGTFYAKIKIACAYSQAEKDSGNFYIDLPFVISEPSLEYTGGFIQIVNVYNISLNLSKTGFTEVPVDNVKKAEYKFLQEGSPVENMGDTLEYTDGKWHWEMNVSGFDDGTYDLWLNFETKDYGNVNGTYPGFSLKHVYKVSGPIVDYDLNTKTIDVKGLRVRTSYANAQFLNSTGAEKAEITIQPAVLGSSNIQLKWNGNYWEALDVDVSKYKPGNYSIKYQFITGSLDISGTSDSFVIYYKYSLENDSAGYDIEKDRIKVTALIKAHNTITSLPAGAILYIKDKDGNVILKDTTLTETLVGTDSISTESRFYNIEGNVSEGTYFVTLEFTDPFGPEYEFDLGTVFVEFDDGDDDDDSDGSDDSSSQESRDDEINSDFPDDDDADDRSGLFAGLFIGLILLMIIIIIAVLLVRNRSQREKDEAKYQAAVDERKEREQSGDHDSGEEVKGSPKKLSKGPIIETSGVDGKDGKTSKDGKDGKTSKDGKDGKTSKDGKDGKPKKEYIDDDFDALERWDSPDDDEFDDEFEDEEFDQDLDNTADLEDMLTDDLEDMMTDEFKAENDLDDPELEYDEAMEKLIETEMLHEPVDKEDSMELYEEPSDERVALLNEIGEAKHHRLKKKSKKGK